MSEVVLSCQSLKKTYEGPAPVHVLLGVDLEVRAGEHVAIMGRSGSGKSTLLHLLGGLDEATDGKVKILGRDLEEESDLEKRVRETGEDYALEKEGRTIDVNSPFRQLARWLGRRKRELAKCRMRNEFLGFVYQFHHLLQEFTAVDNVAMPLLVRRVSLSEARERAAEVLGQLGLGSRLEHQPGELSGGERQRCAFARAMVTEPACVLADEPTGNLDAQTADEVFEAMVRLSENRGTAFVLVTHDAALAARTGRVLTLHEGVLRA